MDDRRSAARTKTFKAASTWASLAHFGSEFNEKDFVVRTAT
jgi:hypothetical protein